MHVLTARLSAFKRSIASNICFCLCRYSPVAADKLPLLVISGGPGLPASYLETLEFMAGVGRQVIFYDQV